MEPQPPLDELDEALRGLIAPFADEDGGWNRGPAGKWSAGQHVDHVGRMLDMGASALERAAERMKRGELPKRPWRDPLQGWVVARFQREPFPSGARSPRAGRPTGVPERATAIATVMRGAERHRALVASLAQEERDRLWMRNPWAPAWLGWHYTLPEVLRVQANHARHHARLARHARGG